jgi:hypothetical protein
MGLFDNSDLLTNRSFSWGLGPYFPPPEALDEFPPDIQRLSLFVGEDGVVNLDNQLRLYKETDPIDASTEPTYSKNNKFILSLEKTLGVVPIYTTILYPAYDPEFGVGLDRKPQGVPGPGWVPCAGQIHTYDKNKRVVVPNIVNDGAIPANYYAPPGMAYIIKIPEGWEKVTKQFFPSGPEVDFDLDLNDLTGYAAPLF